MTGKTFVDSSVLVYAHDMRHGAKHEVARQTLRSLWEQRTGSVSMQVLQEFYVTVTRKLTRPLPRASARFLVEEYAAWCVETTPLEIAAAFRIEDEARISFWDALILAVAVKSGAIRLLSEDLNPGQRIAGISIENPFAQIA